MAQSFNCPNCNAPLDFDGDDQTVRCPYSTVLAKVHEPHGWQETSTNTVFHYIVPIMMVHGWLLFGPRPRIERRTIALAILWPVAWAGYILIYGAITKWYPYPFVDVITHGYGRVIVNAAEVVAVLLVVTLLYWLGDQRLPASGGASGSSP